MAKHEAAAGKKKAPKRKEKRIVPHGVAHIQATFNNTIVTLTDAEGGVGGWPARGKVGFKGSRKGTPFAAQMAAQNASVAAREAGMRTVDVLVTGPGGGRESEIRALQA